MRTRSLLPLILLLAACPSEEEANQAPVVAITAPDPGFSALEGASLEFVGSAADESEPASLTAAWTAGDTVLAEGPVADDGTSRAPWSDLAVGAHDVVFTVTDPEGASASATLSVVVRANTPPTATFRAPSAAGPHYEGAAIAVELVVADAEDDVQALSLAVTIDGEPVDAGVDAAGVWTTDLSLTEGTHALAATVTDSVGAEGAAEVEFEVRGPNAAPSCSIVAPGDGDVITDEATFVFEGSVSDDHTPVEELGITLESSVDGVLVEPTADPQGTISWTTDSLSSGVHDLTLTVVDDTGEACTATAQLTRSRPPSVGIYAPSRHSVWNDTDLVHFEGIVYDADDDETTLASEWSSDVDGILGSSIPSVSGDVELDIAGLTPGLHDISLTVTDSSGWQATAVLPILVNGTPTTPGISLAPDPATTTQPLVASIDVLSTDIDGDIPTYEYAWSVGGVPMSAYDGLATLPASATTKGDVWEVSVSATDGVGTSPAATATATIINSAPSVQSAYVDPPFGLATTIYSAIGVGFADDDLDPEGYQYQWFVNGVLQAGATSATFDPTGAPPGATFHCELTAWDGTVAGNTVVSASATLNTAPVLSSIATNPAGTSDETRPIVATGTTSDVDNQTVTVQWQWHDQNGPIAGATTDTLTGADFDRGDVVFVVGTPDDGVETGAPLTGPSVTIVNAPPSVASASISPTSAFINTQLTCSYTGFSDPDAGDTDQSTIEWSAGGQVIGTGPTISGGYNASQTVICSVTPSDGTDTGTPVTATIIISNNPPVLSSLAIQTPVTRDGPAVSIASTSDPDGDPVTLITNWTRNGTFVSTSPALAPSLFVKGDSLSISSTPSDGNLTGNTLTAGPVVVQNAGPTTPSILLAPPVPEAGVDSLDCTVQTNSTDSDTGDVLTYAFSWSVDGNPWNGPVATTGVHPGDRIPGTSTLDDQVWTCTVVVTDDDPTPASAAPATDSIEVRACGSIDFSGAPAGLVLDWSGSLSGSPYADLTVETWVRGGPVGSGFILTSYDSAAPADAWLNGGLPWATHFLGGTWFHVARVWDSANNQLRSYVNGVLRDTSAYSAPHFGDQGLYIGASDTAGSGNYWNGELAGLRVSNTVRYSAGFTTPGTYSVDANTVLFVPMTNSVSGEAFDDGPSTFPIANNANATLGSVGLYCD